MSGVRWEGVLNTKSVYAKVHTTVFDFISYIVFTRIECDIKHFFYLFANSVELLWYTILFFVLFERNQMAHRLKCIHFLFAAILFTTAILFYMVGLDSDVANDICGTSSVFKTGDCQIGWSYLLLIFTSSFCFLLPVLSHYTDHTICAKQRKMEPPEYVA